MNLWYPSDVTHVITLEATGSVGATRLDGGLRGLGPNFMKIAFGPSATLDLGMRVFLCYSTEFSKESNI